MRHTLQRILPVRLQFGTVGHVPNGRTPDSLQLTADTIGGPETRLTRETLDALRETGRLDTQSATVMRMLDTRRGRKTLRALLYRYRQGMPITWPA